MKVLCASLTSLALVMSTTLPLEAQTWHLLVERLLEKSVVQVGVSCTAFVINEAEDYVLTARHCGDADPEKPVIVDLRPGRVVATDAQKDLLVVHVPGLDRPALRFAARAPLYGEAVASFGYGGGYERPMLRVGRVSQPKAIVPDAGAGEWVLLDAALVPGMSGGPIVNEAGEVIMMVQMTSDRTGLGRSADTIKDRIGRWIERPRP